MGHLGVVFWFVNNGCKFKNPDPISSELSEDTLYSAMKMVRCYHSALKIKCKIFFYSVV